VSTGEDDGILVGSEQAQTLQAPAERVTFHSGADFPSIGSLRDFPVEVPEKLTKIGSSRLESNSRLLGPQRMRDGAEHQIHIDQLKVSARVGVPRAERARRQRLVLNITLWPMAELGDLQDAIVRTVDYSAVSQEAKQFLSRQTPKLIETLANDLASHLLRKFEIRKVNVEIRKFVLKDAAYVSVTVTRCASPD
jgi:dihydroneopterin aldolase